MMITYSLLLASVTSRKISSQQDKASSCDKTLWILILAPACNGTKVYILLRKNLKLLIIMYTTDISISDQPNAYNANAYIVHYII